MSPSNAASSADVGAMPVEIEGEAAQQNVVGGARGGRNSFGIKFGVDEPIDWVLGFTGGQNGFLGERKAQWVSYSAPSLIQRSRISLSLAVSGFFVSGGGMSSSGSVEWRRKISSLSSALPRTMASRTASSRTSSRSFALRDFSSGPWQLKQWSERIGCTSVRHQFRFV